MKEYIRTTHNFNNTTRMWEYRGNKGGDKYELWNLPETREKIDKILFRPLTIPRKWSLGVHALMNDRWMSMKWILWETTTLLMGNVTDMTTEFNTFIDSTPNHDEIMERDITEELKILIELDMVRERDI